MSKITTILLNLQTHRRERFRSQSEFRREPQQFC